MIRVTSGQYRGRGVDSPPRSKEIRPTTSLMRESIFNQLQWVMPGSRFLDLFAGSGIMGLEALSRGADFVLAIEQDAEQCRVIRKNYQAIGLTPAQVKIVPCDVVTLLQKACREAPFDCIFMDPPYGFKHLEALIDNAKQNGWLKPNGWIVVEHGSREPALAGFQRKVYGDSVLSIWQAESL